MAFTILFRLIFYSSHLRNATMKSIHFISGLPRSGSTLLSAILSQNPKFHASISSPLPPIFNAAYNAMGFGNESISFITDEQRSLVLEYIVNSFYNPINDRTIFDTSRIWTSRTAQILNLFPESKMICTVRCVSWIVDSIERLIRKNYLSPSRMFNQDAANMNVYGRVNALVQPTGMIGQSFNNLREAVFSEFRSRIMLVTYESLVRNPDTTLQAIYAFIGETGDLIYDMENIAFPPATQAAIEDFDRRLNTPGLHSVRPKIEKIERQTILPPDIFQAHLASTFWNEAEFRETSGVLVI
jgi:sulfotransferase